MNFGVIVSALEFAIEHRKEIAADAECAIHVIRRIEHACVKHDTSVDHILVAADNFLQHVAEATPPPASDSD